MLEQLVGMSEQLVGKLCFQHNVETTFKNITFGKAVGGANFMYSVEGCVLSALSCGEIGVHGGNCLRYKFRWDSKLPRTDSPSS